MEPFFVFGDRTPVEPRHMRAILKLALKDARFDCTLYLVHGCRWGRASDLLKMGVDIDTIKKLGRWKSNTVYTYLHYSI